MGKAHGPAMGTGASLAARAAGANPDPGFGRVGAGVDHPAARRVADDNRAGTLPTPMASGTGDQTTEIPRRYRSTPCPARQRAGRSLPPRQAALCLAIGNVGAPTIRQRLGSPGRSARHGTEGRSRYYCQIGINP